MKAFGDIPEEHSELIKELNVLENWFYENKDKVASLDVAKGFTCMAYDYYAMDFEEEGERLLRIVDKECPGYFKGPIYSHMAKDELFDILVYSLKKTLALDTLYYLGFGE